MKSLKEDNLDALFIPFTRFKEKSHECFVFSFASLFFVFFLEILVHVRVKKPKIQWELLSPTQNTAPEVPRQ